MTRESVENGLWFLGQKIETNLQKIWALRNSWSIWRNHHPSERWPKLTDPKETKKKLNIPAFFHFHINDTSAHCVFAMLIPDLSIKNQHVCIHCLIPLNCIVFNSIGTTCYNAKLLRNVQRTEKYWDLQQTQQLSIRIPYAPWTSTTIGMWRQSFPFFYFSRTWNANLRQSLLLQSANIPPRLKFPPSKMLQGDR